MTSPVIYFDARRKTSIYSSFIALIIIGCYNLLRIGVDFHLMESMKTAGFILFMLNVPVLIIEWITGNKENKLLKDEFFWMFIVLITSCVLGFLDVKAGYFFLIAGVTCLLLNFFKYIKSATSREFVSLIFIFVIGIWLCLNVWDGDTLHPMLLERLAADNRIHIDTIFHVSLAQMIKTYSVPSTGLNGLPFYHYHFGSHVIFAWLSKTLNINLFAFYQLSFPAVFLPLFVKSVLGLPIAWSEKKERVFNFNLWLWAAISAALIGVFPLYSVLAKALLEVLPVFASESYCVSIVLTFFFFNILLFNHDEKATGWVGFNLSVSLVLLGLVFLIGLSKNSTLFMIDILILYLFVRFKLYREWKAWLLFGIVGLMSIICLYLTVDSKSGDGSFVPFDFYERYTTLSVFDFLFVYFFWSIVLVGSCLFVIFFKKKADTPKYFITLAEIGLLISIVGALPGTFFSIAGGSAGYFMNVQMCFSLIFFLMILPEVIENLKIARGKIEESHKKRLVSIFLIVFTVMACINIQNNFRKSIKVYVKHTWEDKARICGISLESKPATFFGMVKDIVSLNSKIGSCLSSNTTYTIFQQLSELDTIPLKEKSKSILKLKNVNLLAEKFPCYKYPFFFTSLTGLALENGFVLDDCLDAQNYSFEYYRRADIEAQTPRQPATEFVISLDSGKVQLETLHSESATR